ncbi:MAG: gamma-glutamyltransferase [Pyrinomonadaceae bacterium]
MKTKIGKLLLSASFVAILLAIQVFPAWREPVRAKNAMVASQHKLASEIGASIMKKGGNAIDAAVAVGLALAVVYPEAGNLGGGGFMLIRLDNGKTAAIDYREMAPQGATRDIYVDEKGELIRGEGGSVIGYRAAGVPGTPAGLEFAFKKYGSGKVSWAEVVQPAENLAKNGFVLSYRLAELFKSYRGNLEKYEDSKRIFLNNGDFYDEGDTLKQPDLGKTLERIRKTGASDFYKGVTARLIAEDMARNNGLITMADLANYEVKERTALQGKYRGNTIISMPPPSSGGIVMFQVLGMLERYDLASMGQDSSERLHLLNEALRRSFADRAEFMGDPDFSDVPVAKLLSGEYIKLRGDTINASKATPSNEIGPGKPYGQEGMETTHFTVIDPSGNVVSNTYTINNLYGNAVTAKGTGVLLNDEMDDFAARPGKPNLFGLIQGERNAVGPRKRPLSSMTPTIVLDKDGKFWFAVGARGGPRIITAVLQSTMNMIDHGMNIQEALDAPRIHHQWLPDLTIWEQYGLSPDTRKQMEAMGHKFTPSPMNIASATAVAVDSKGVRLGAIDSRSDGEAIGY